MKKAIFCVLFAMFLFLPSFVLAEGYISASPGSLTIQQGSSATFTITAYNAVGDVAIVSNNSGIASVSTGYWETGIVGEKQTKSGVVTVNGVNVGTTTIILTIDAATFDSEELTGQTRTITVNVISKPDPDPAPASTPSAPSSSNNNKNNLNSNNNGSKHNVVSDDKNSNKELSKNSNLKSLTVEGYKIEKVDNNNYTLVVRNDVTNIMIGAIAADSKAKISGTGNHKLKVGENNFELVVTSESGSKNKINLKVTRKDGYYLEDLEALLKDERVKDINIIVDLNSKISSNLVNKIKESGKVVRLNCYDKGKKLIYSWLLDGSKIKDTNGFITTISYDSQYAKEILKLSNYADGLYINFKNKGQFPEGTKIKIYVGNKFDDNSIVNVYYYNKSANRLELTKDNLIVKDGYIELKVDNGFEHFVTMSIIPNKIESNNSSFNIFIIFSIILVIIIISLIIYLVKVRTGAKKGNLNNISDKNNDNISVNPFNEISQNKETPVINPFNGVSQNGEENVINSFNEANQNNEFHEFDENINKTEVVSIEEIKKNIDSITFNSFDGMNNGDDKMDRD